MTRYFAVLGDPIAHSLSPMIHQAWIDAANIDAQYKAIRIADGAFAATVADLQEQGFVGFNVTMPHKQAALAFADKASAAAVSIGAANTLSFNKNEKSWFAENTDAPGFKYALEHLLGGPIEPNTDILILGAGGAARGIVYCLRQCGITPKILNRTIQRADDLSTDLLEGSAITGNLDDIAQYIRTETILINTTSAGHSGGGLPLPDLAGRLFYDISYGAAAEVQLQRAARIGWPVSDGLSMLVAQAAESFRSWFGVQPDFEKALLRCRNTLNSHT